MLSTYLSLLEGEGGLVDSMHRMCDDYSYCLLYANNVMTVIYRRYIIPVSLHVHLYDNIVAKLTS